MFEELEKYKNNGHFFFQRDSRLRDVSNDVPNDPGVYIIYKLAKGRIELVYIGKAGTMIQDGTFKNQGLKGRINNKQDGKKREDFFLERIKEEDIEALDIYWYVTFDKNNQDLPAYIEGMLLQIHFDIYGRPPFWNKNV